MPLRKMNKILPLALGLKQSRMDAVDLIGILGVLEKDNKCEDGTGKPIIFTKYIKGLIMKEECCRERFSPVS